jgi:hypothetical protein
MLSFRRVKTAFLRPFTLSIPLGFRLVENMFISCKCFWFFIFNLSIYRSKTW